MGPGATRRRAVPVLWTRRPRLLLLRDGRLGLPVFAPSRSRGRRRRRRSKRQGVNYRSRRRNGSCRSRVANKGRRSSRGSGSSNREAKKMDRSSPLPQSPPQPVPPAPQEPGEQEEDLPVFGPPTPAWLLPGAPAAIPAESGRADGVVALACMMRTPVDPESEIRGTIYGMDGIAQGFLRERRAWEDRIPPEGG